MKPEQLAMLCALLEKFGNETNTDVSKVYESVWDEATKEMISEEFYAKCTTAYDEMS